MKPRWVVCLTVLLMLGGSVYAQVEPDLRERIKQQTLQQRRIAHQQVVMQAF